jgi:hypothetical protein
MKKYLLIASFLFLTACEEEFLGNSQDVSSSSSGIASSSSSFMEFPQMDERVVAYGGGAGSRAPETLVHTNITARYQISADIDEMKESFQVALNEDNFDPECDYFAIYITAGESRTYFIISKDLHDPLKIYNIHPSLEQPNAPSWGAGGCMYENDLRTHGFLICDKNGSLKDKLMLNVPQIMVYNDPTWDCWGEGRFRYPFFELRE